MEGITDPSDHTLIHYGVPGMKWGKRSSKSSKSSSSKNKPTPFKKDPNREPPPAKGVTDLRPKHIKRISDVELRQRINRIQMETQYKDLTEGKKPDSSNKLTKSLENFEKGHKAVQKGVAVINTAQKLYKIYDSPMVRAMMGREQKEENDKKKK